MKEDQVNLKLFELEMHLRSPSGDIKWMSRYMIWGQGSNLAAMTTKLLNIKPWKNLNKDRLHLFDMYCAKPNNV